MNNEKPKNPLRDKSYAFAIKIVRLSQALVSEKKEFYSANKFFAMVLQLEH